jgi:flagellar protein FliS
MALNPYQKYQENKIEGSSQGEMIILLYEGSIRFMNEAIDFIKQKDIPKAHAKIIKAQRIINELMVTLDFDAGGEIAKNLYNLYDFVMNELIKANIKKEPQGLLNSIEVMQELLDAWKIVVQKEESKNSETQGIKSTINFKS